MANALLVRLDSTIAGLDGHGKRLPRARGPAFGQIQSPSAGALRGSSGAAARSTSSIALVSRQRFDLQLTWYDERATLGGTS
jgi:hypothetical protein